MPVDSPFAMAESAFLASERARSDAKCTTALSFGFTSSILRRCASTTSSADTFLFCMASFMLFAEAYKISFMLPLWSTD